MSETPGLVVIGAGGHAKIVVATLLDLGASIDMIVDDVVYRQDARLWDLPVSGPIDAQPLSGRPAVLAIGDNAARQRLAGRLDCDWQVVIHPTAYVHPTARLGEGAFVAAGAVIQPDSVVGAHTIVNTGATIDHDCVVGPHAHIAPGANLAGEVELGAGVLVGVGAAIAPRVRIGDWAVLGAGAVAVRDLPAGVTAVGVPARARDDG